MTTIREQVKTLTPAQRAQFARQLKHKLTHPAESRQQVDVLIMGGGLAGLTLARQLRRTHSDLSILVVDKVQHPVPEAAYKVGESTVELGSYYLREVLDLADELERNHLFKAGLRYYFPAGKKDDISRRVEMGAAIIPAIRSHQVDRGRFENTLWRQNQVDGVECWDQCNIQRIDLGDPQHVVTIRRGEREWSIRARWLVDASGRAALLKRQLGLVEPSPHNAGAAWFRINDKIDIDDWSTEPAWRARTPPGIRWLGTNHLMDRGYWVWLIPLVNNITSIGIVADESIHPHRTMNRFDRALDWLKEHEPQCADVIANRQHLLQDFRALRHYAHGCRRVFSSQRWCLTGEAGVFSDPFYSPGTDFIAMSNSLITDLILREVKGESIQERVEFYNRRYLDTHKAVMPLYQGQYRLMGNAQVMIAKFAWDWACYWGVTAPLFFHNNKLFDPVWAPAMADELNRYNALSTAMQAFFHSLPDTGQTADSAAYIDVFSFPFLQDLQLALEARLEDEPLKQRLRDNLALLESLAEGCRSRRSLPNRAGPFVFA